MQTRWLVWGIIWRMMAWGAGLSGGLGGLLGGLLVSGAGASTTILGAELGTVIGGTLGLVLGLAIGTALTIVTARASYTLIDAYHYRLIAGRVGLAVVDLVYLLLGIWVVLLTQSITGWAVGACLPLLIASSAGWWVSRRVASWVIRMSRPVSASSDGP